MDRNPTASKYHHDIKTKDNIDYNHLLRELEYSRNKIKYLETCVKDLEDNLKIFVKQDEMLLNYLIKNSQLHNL